MLCDCRNDKMGDTEKFHVQLVLVALGIFLIYVKIMISSYLKQLFKCSIFWMQYWRAWDIELSHVQFDGNSIFTTSRMWAYMKIMIRSYPGLIQFDFSFFYFCFFGLGLWYQFLNCCQTKYICYLLEAKAFKNNLLGVCKYFNLNHINNFKWFCFERKQ